MRETLEQLVATGRLLRDLPAFARRPIGPAEATATIKRRLETRTGRFLAIAAWGIYGYSRSPYRRLLRAAGCELGDLRALVTTEGLEGALERLARRGVYLDFDEYKGQRPVVRGSERFVLAGADLDNPREAPHLFSRTGGTRGAGSVVKISLSLIASHAPNIRAALEVYGFEDGDHVLWMITPVTQVLRAIAIGHRPIAWFYPVAPLHWRVRLLGELLHRYGRWIGCPLPRPVYLDLRESERMARWLAARLAEGRRLVFSGYTSSIVRVAEAADCLGLSLAGTLFQCIGEPFTRAKLAALEAVGALGVPSYSATEAGIMAKGCTAALASDDMHVFTDAFAMIPRHRGAGESDDAIASLHVTTLLESASKILLNVDLGDYAELGRRECGCPFEAIGLREHMWDVGSHEKLTSEGMTFVRSRLVRLLEEELPARFGGASTDYQLVEEEGPGGIPRLLLLVDPRLGVLDEAALRRTFLAILRADDLPGQYMARVWEHADTVRVRREAPRATGAGKVLPFHLERRQGA